MTSSPTPPGPPAPPPPPAPPNVPWERRRELGFVSALFQTVRESLFDPVAFYRRVDPRGPIAPALLYATLIGVVAATFTLLWELAVPSPWGGIVPAETRAEAIPSVVASLALWALTPILTPLAVLIGAAIYHLVLLVLGGPSQGYGGTVRATAYAAAPELLALVPFCGGFIAIPWLLVLYVIGLREVHGIQTGKAIAVVLIPFLMCAILVGLMVALVLATVAGRVAGGGLF